MKITKKLIGSLASVALLLPAASFASGGGGGISELENRALQAYVNDCDVKSQNYKSAQGDINLLTNVSVYPLFGDHVLVVGESQSGDGYQGLTIGVGSQDDVKTVSVVVNKLSGGVLKLKSTIDTVANEQEVTDNSCLLKPHLNLANSDPVTIVGPNLNPFETEVVNQALDALEAVNPGLTINFIPAPVQEGDVPGFIALGADIIVLQNPTLNINVFNDGLSRALSKSTKAAAAANHLEDVNNYYNVGSEQVSLLISADAKSQVFFNTTLFKDPDGVPYDVPTTWDGPNGLKQLTQTMVDNGQTAWCVGIESGGATGFTFTDWVEDMMLSLYPTSVYDQWVTNEVKFSDPMVMAAWQEVIDLWNINGFGGIGGGRFVNNPIEEVKNGQYIAFNSFFNAVGTFVGSTSADGCLLHKQGNFILQFFDSSEFDVFRFPPNDPANDAFLLVGNSPSVVNDKDAVKAVMLYLGTPDYAERVVAPRPGVVTAALGVDQSVFLPLAAKIYNLILNSRELRFDASDLMPAEVGQRFITDPFSGLGGFWYEGTTAVIGEGNSVDFGFIVDGKTVEDATAAIDALFCTLDSTPPCP